MEAWVKRHSAAGVAVHTFVSIKVRDAKERAAERKTKRERKAARRDQAQSLRRDRFTKRQAEARA